MLALLSLLLWVPLPQAGPDPAEVSAPRLGRTLEALCRRPRLAGDPRSRFAADYAAMVFEQAGLKVERAVYQVFLPRQTEQRLALLLPDGTRSELDLHETGYPEDPRSLRDQLPPMNAFSAPGAVFGAVFFAGKGTRKECQALKKEFGDRLAGAVALIRYGGLYRGRKVQNAADAGFAAALLYTDAEDDGAPKGKVLPEGPWRPPSGIQRGSIFNGEGDPATPGWASVEGAPRLPRSKMKNLPVIPSLPISWENASRMFGAAGRPEKPGSLEARVDLKVVLDPAPVQIQDVLGRVEGATRPDEWIVLGAHRDSWGFGAVDNGGGCAVLLETARIVGLALARGWRPERTLIFATWDGEEWGLVGSHEWVEEHRSELLDKGVAYLNLDVVASGPEFGGFATPGAASLLRRVCLAEHITPPEDLGTPGGGSDHVPFLELAGQEVLGFGFHGGNGTYHSAFDTPFAVEHFLDPGYRLHQRAARLAVRMTAELSRSGTRLDGLADWVARARDAAKDLALEAPDSARLVQALADLARAVAERSTPPPHPERFLRLFVPVEPGGHCLLWGTHGYAGSWFPEVAAAGAAGRDPGPALEPLLGKIETVRRLIQALPPPTGR